MPDDILHDLQIDGSSFWIMNFEELRAATDNSAGSDQHRTGRRIIRNDRNTVA